MKQTYSSANSSVSKVKSNKSTSRRTRAKGTTSPRHEKPQSSLQHIPTREEELIALDQSLTKISTAKESKILSCLNHQNTRAVYSNRYSDINLCVQCAIKHTMVNRKVHLKPYLSSDENQKKDESDSFLRRLKFTQNILQGDVERFERANDELERKHLSNTNQINIFFDHISAVFTETYTKVMSEKESFFQEAKRSCEEVHGSLLENIQMVNKLENDITSNYERIVLGMEMGPFKKIMGECIANLEMVQEFTERNQISEVVNYKEIVEKPRKVENINETLQRCLNQIYDLFDPQLGERMSSQGSLMSKNLNQEALNEELQKINECFYNNTFVKSRATDKDDSRKNSDGKRFRLLLIQRSRKESLWGI